MLPTALSILICLQTSTIESDRVYTAYLVAFWGLAVQGLISLTRWWISNRSHDKLIGEIRARMPTHPRPAEQMPVMAATIEPGPPPVEGGEAAPTPIAD